MGCERACVPECMHVRGTVPLLHAVLPAALNLIKAHKQTVTSHCCDTCMRGN